MYVNIKRYCVAWLSKHYSVFRLLPNPYVLVTVPASLKFMLQLQQLATANVQSK
jgi:hypothetical protein